MDFNYELVKRDVAERGFDVAGVLTLYQRFVKPSYDNYVYPTKRNADVVCSTLRCFHVLLLCWLHRLTITFSSSA